MSKLAIKVPYNGKSLQPLNEEVARLVRRFSPSSGTLITIGLNKDEISVITSDELLLKLLKEMYPGSIYTSEGENTNENLHQTG